MNLVQNYFPSLQLSLELFMRVIGHLSLQNSEYFLLMRHHVYDFTYSMEVHFSPSFQDSSDVGLS